MPLNFVAKAAITVALTAANMALTMSRKIEGPRLDNLKFTSGDFGAPLPMVWGTRRMEVPIFWAEDLREVKRRRKTKGGKFNEYTYYGTWAVALAGHEIEAVSRIWFDTHLVYDLTGTGPVTPFDFGVTGASIEETIAIYLGTSTQDPDPRMQATVESEFGEGSCPAYRDTAYIVFKDIPLEKLGNRIPQVSVEIVGNVSNIFPSEVVAGAVGESRTFSYDYSTLLFVDYSQLSMVDTAARAVLTSYDDWGVNVSDNTEHYAFLENGDALSTNETGDAQNAKSLLTGVVTDYDDIFVNGNGTTFSEMYGETEYVCFVAFFSFFINGVEVDPNDLFGNGFALGIMFKDVDGDIWIAGSNLDDPTEAIFHRLTDEPRTVRVTGLPTNDGAVRAYHYLDSDDDHFVMAWNTDLYAVSREDGTILTSNTAVDYPNGLTIDAFVAVIPGADSFYAGFEEIDSATLTQVRLLDYRDWVGGSTEQASNVYDPINHALVVGNRWCYLDRIGSAGVPLSLIAGDVADMVGVETHDFSDLDQEIMGWSTTRGQASNMLEPLLDAYDSDIRPHDFGIEGIKRTGVATGSTLTTEWFAGDPRYSVTVKQELPRALLIDFADLDADQQPNTARADRPLDATDARGELKIDLTTLALDPDEAIQLANRHFRRRWNERRELSLGLTAKELKLEPGDVRTLELDGDEKDYRCTSLTVRADDTLATEWRYDHPSLAELDGSAGAAFDGRDPSVVVVPLLSKGFVLDIPLLDDSDDATPPQVYPLMAPYADGSWPGGTIYQKVDAEYSEELSSKASSDAVTWGSVAEAMPYTNPNVWDRGTEITVTLQTGTLTGCTEEAANADPTLNRAAIGTDGRWEIVQFTNATLDAPLTYTLSGFKRGRRGTEWAAELHEASDTFVLIDEADPVAMGLSEVGTEVSFKPITAGRTTGFPIGYTYEGQSLKPYAPAHLEAVKESNGDWTLTWVRRTRVGGAWTSGSVIPLGEATEEYELTLSDGVDTVTKTVTSPTYTWLQADQVTEVGAEVMAGSLDWTVNQQSDAVGDGFLAEATA